MIDSDLTKTKKKQKQIGSSHRISRRYLQRCRDTGEESLQHSAAGSPRVPLFGKGSGK